MKIDKIIFSSNDNPDYLFYWEINAKVCREVLEIEPVLFWITDEDSDFYHDGHGLVKKIKKLPDHIIEEWGQTFHSSAFQAQNVRLWGTKFFPEEVCLTSDIDLILFNNKYLDENVIGADPDDFVILGSDAYDPQRPEGGNFGTPRYPIPYLCGKGKTFSEILDLYSDYKPFIQRLALFNNGFDTDELYVGKMISEYTGNIKIHKNIRGYSSFFYCNRRIEKFHFYYIEYPHNIPAIGLQLDLSGYLCLDYYIDVHLPRPYENFKEKVDNLMKYIFELKKNKSKKLFEYFDKAYCINLETRPDRLSHFKSEVSKYNLGDYEIVYAVNGYDVYHNYPPIPEGPGPVGLLLTNLKIIEDAKSKNYETIVILEDDCTFNDEIVNIEEYMKSLPDDWDMLYFGANHTDNDGIYHAPYHINNNVIRLVNSFTTHLVAIKSHMFDIIIQKINEMWKPIDVIYCDIQQKFKVYCFNPMLAVQYPNFSNIMNSETNYLDLFHTNKTKKYVTNKLNGRIGNCLFEIATAYSLSLETEKKYICDISDHIVDSLQLDYKNYTTNIFRNLEFDSIKFDYLDYREKSNEYASIDFYENNLKLFGYFQSEKYFVKYREKILKLFEIDDVTKEYLSEKYSNSLEGDACSIHVRRGDYLKYDYNHTVLSIEYYRKACHLIGLLNKFLIFSDDLEWCKENFNFLPNILFVENNKDYEDLYLMSMCKHHIIANSSFSWWGSWLNSHNNKKVIAPKNWFGPDLSHLNTKDLYCEGWIVI